MEVLSHSTVPFTSAHLRQYLFTRATRLISYLLNADDGLAPTIYWVYMAVYSCIWLHMAVDGCTGLYTAALAAYGCIWLYMDRLGYTWL